MQTDTLTNLSIIQNDIDKKNRRIDLLNQGIAAKQRIQGEEETCETYASEIETIKTELQTLYKRFNVQYSFLKPYILNKIPQYT